MAPEPVIRIAIADDHPSLVAGNKFIINSFAGCDVIIEAYDGDSLLQRIETAPLPPHLCLLDVSMPGLNGFEVLIAIKKQWPEIKVIMQSIYYEDFNIINAFKLGAAAYLAKEATPAELEEAIYEVHTHGSHFNKWIAKNIMPRLNHKDNLTETDIRLLKLCCTNMTYKQMADEMSKSLRTIDDYRDRLFEKLGTHSRIGLALFAIKCGIVPLSTPLPAEKKQIRK